MGTLSDPDLDEVLLQATERRIGAGEFLYREGDPGDSMGIVVAGELAIRSAGPHGAVVDLRKVGAGEIVGELACVDPAPRSASVVATVPTTLLELNRGGLDHLLADAPRAGSHLLGFIVRSGARRLRDIDEQISVELGDPIGDGPTRPTEPRPVTARDASSPRPSPPAGPPPAALSAWQRLLGKLRGAE